MAYTGKRFIRKANSPTVYMREGSSLRPIQSPDEFRMLSGSNDIAGLTDVVDNLDQYNQPVGSFTGLSEDEKANYFTKARNRYAGTRKQFSDLMTGKVGQTDLDFEDAKTRINRGADDAITGAAQDLSSRGFLRSGEQVDRTVRSKEDAATNVGRADIQRQIQRANLLLEQTQFDTDMEKQISGEANTEIGQEYTRRQTDNQNMLAQREGEQNRLAQAWDTSMALQASREERDSKRKMLEMELAKLRASNGGGTFDIPAMLKAIQGLTPQQKEQYGLKDITNDDVNAFAAALPTSGAMYQGTSIGPDPKKQLTGIGYGVDANGFTLYPDKTRVKDDPFNGAKHGVKK